MLVCAYLGVVLGVAGSFYAILWTLHLICSAIARKTKALHLFCSFVMNRKEFLEFLKDRNNRPSE